MTKWVGGFFIVFLMLSQAMAIEPGEALKDPDLEARARVLSLELRCMVCQNQSIDDSDAPLAGDLRMLVRERLLVGDSEEQIFELVTARYGDLSKQQQQQLVKELCAGSYTINGKSTFKEEFVTAGGVNLKEINFKTFESKLHPNLFFAGEVLDIDAVTGGFNFQAAWTGGYLAALGMAVN